MVTRPRRPARPSWRSVPASALVLYVCIPTYNEAVTVGVLLWRLRTMLREQAGGRDYEVVVYDDASTDATADVLALATELRKGTIERVIGMSDLDLGLQALLGSRGPGRRQPDPRLCVQYRYRAFLRRWAFCPIMVSTATPLLAICVHLPLGHGLQ